MALNLDASACPDYSILILSHQQVEAEKTGARAPGRAGLKAFLCEALIFLAFCLFPARSQVLLHYFGYLRRNPDDPPDGNLDGFNFWLKEVDASGDVGRLARGFMASDEYKNKDGR